MSDAVAVFDLDGTLIDSDEALIAPFLALGVLREDITFGHTLAHECRRFGFTVEDYLAHYDVTLAQPFPGAGDLVTCLDRWAVCSNKDHRSGIVELDRLGWAPEVSLFADAFAGAGKSLGPVLDSLGLGPAEVIFIGDTSHDRRCADEVGCRFAWAGWNPRARPVVGDQVLESPLDVLDLLAP